MPTLAAHLGQARALSGKGRFLQAIEVCKAGLALDSTSVDLYNLMATAYAAEGRYTPPEEVAEALGKPSRDAARMTVTRALRRLAESMARQDRPPDVKAG